MSPIERLTISRTWCKDHPWIRDYTSFYEGSFQLDWARNWVADIYRFPNGDAISIFILQTDPEHYTCAWIPGSTFRSNKTRVDMTDMISMTGTMTNVSKRRIELFFKDISSYPRWKGDFHTREWLGLAK